MSTLHHRIHIIKLLLISKPGKSRNLDKDDDSSEYRRVSVKEGDVLEHQHLISHLCMRCRNFHLCIAHNFCHITYWWSLFSLKYHHQMLRLNKLEYNISYIMFRTKHSFTYFVLCVCVCIYYIAIWKELLRSDLYENVTCCLIYYSFICTRW